MSCNKSKDGVVSNRLDQTEYLENFSDVHPPLDNHEALVEADRCYFCHDAPCMTACPTSIDIPMFIRQISTSNTLGSAKTIFDQNILGGMCARVCPTETLCEEVCVREIAEGKPVKIGLLQRHATDEAMNTRTQFYKREKSTGKKVAIVGAGPAGLSCAHRLSIHGHDVEIFDAAEKSGGLNEYGIASYKTVDGFAQDEIDYITDIGGININHGKALGKDISLDDLASQYDAVFLGMGLSDVNQLSIAGAEAEGIEDAVDFISNLRQSDDLAKIEIGRKIVVIGGGMTAIDAAIQAKLLGAENVTICYRRGAENMNASQYEQNLATSKGVIIRHWLQPGSVASVNGKLSSIQFEYTENKNGKLAATGETMAISADQIFVAIGQKLSVSDLEAGSNSVKIENGRIAVDEEFKTSISGIWAGGDCIADGEDLTVSAVAHGRDAAESINRTLES